MAVYRLGEMAPKIPPSAYVADEATVIGNVTMGEKVSVWPGAVIRGDNEPIQIGVASNVQDNAVLHTDPGYSLVIGANVTIGHQAMLHGCKVGDGALIGIQAVVLNGAVIGKDCLIGAGAVVTEGKHFPDRSLILGAPAKVVRELSDDAIIKMHTGVRGYVKRGEMYKAKLQRIE